MTTARRKPVDHQANMMREEADFQRRQKEWREARIRKVARDNPDLTPGALAERFCEAVPTINELLGKEEVERRNREDILRRDDFRAAKDGTLYIGWRRRA
jgi:hypothetical protein